MADDGVILRTEHTTILDTRLMPWQPHFGIPGAFGKVLSTDCNGSPLVFLTYLPEDFEGSALPSQHASRSADQRTLVLDGELATIEYGATGPVAITAMAGYWLHHPPGASFGVPQTWAPPAGALLLTFRSGPATLPAEEGFSDEVTVAVAAAETPPPAPAGNGVGVVYHDPLSGSRVLDTRAMPWAPHFGMHLGKTKTLTADVNGAPLAYLTKTPGFAPGQVAPKGSGERHFHRNLVEQIFVTGGELTMREYASLDDRAGQTIVLRAGYFLDRTPGSIHQLERRSATGFASLEVRDKPGNYPFDEGFEELNYIEKMS